MNDPTQNGQGKRAGWPQKVVELPDGTTGTWYPPRRDKNLAVGVRVLATRDLAGRIDVLISPIAGDGQAWVGQATVAID